MKYIQFISIILISLCSCTSTEKSNIEPVPESQPEITDSVYVGFNMYFLKDEKLNGSTVSYTDLKELELQNQPFVSQGNIEYNIDKATRKQPDGRIWIGKVSAKYFISIK